MRDAAQTLEELKQKDFGKMFEDPDFCSHGAAILNKIDNTLASLNGAKEETQERVKQVEEVLRQKITQLDAKFDSLEKLVSQHKYDISKQMC